MKRTLTIALALVIGCWLWSPAAAGAQQTKGVRGKVTAVSADSLSVKAGEKDYTFTVDDKTQVIARGAGTKTRQAQRQGKPGIQLTDAVKVGDGVAVRYHDMGGKLHAATVRAGIDVGAGMTAERTSGQATKRATGTVSSVSASSLTIKSGGKDMTFAVDNDTRVVGRGIGTMASAKKAVGAGLKITDAVSEGDTVTVNYHEMGGSMHASQVRVTRKKT